MMEILRRAGATMLAVAGLAALTATAHGQPTARNLCVKAPCPQPPASGQRLQPGLWSVTTLINGRSAGQANARCISPQEARTANGSDADVTQALRAAAAKDGCTVKAVSISGPTIAFTTVCGGVGVTSRITYRGGAYDGTMTTAIGGRTNMTTMKGVRQGACAAAR